jgi:hypothetical protein
MTAMTETGIVNLALREIGDYRITDIEEDSTPAEIARDLIDQARRSALIAHEWRFALKQAELNALVTAPTARYATAWQLPSDFVRLGSVAEDDTMDPPLEDYRVIADTLQSSTDYIFIEYVYDAPDVGTWPPYFNALVAAMLASDMASPLKSTTERERLEKLLYTRLMHARTLDSVQSPVQLLPASDWLSAMRGLRRP